MSPSSLDLITEAVNRIDANTFIYIKTILCIGSAALTICQTKKKKKKEEKAIFVADDKGHQHYTHAFIVVLNF